MTGAADLEREGSDAIDADAAVDRIRSRGETIKRRELEEALARLDGDPDPEERAVIRRMADRIVGSLLGEPAATIERARADDDPEAIRAVTRIFDPDGDA